MFDWLSFLDAHRIEYTTQGAGRGNIFTRCPWCGGDGSGRPVMSINLEGKGWYCFWCKTRRSGKSPVRLIAALIGCSFERAAEIAGVRVSLPDDFSSKLRSMLAPESVSVQTSTSLTMPDEFRSFLDLDGRLAAKPSARPFVNHLRYVRKLSDADIERACRLFDLRYCVRGRFSGRIIFPVTYQSRLVGWTGRTVGDDKMRYRANDGDGDAITNYLLWYDQIVEAYQQGAETIYVVEGPFDALKVWALGRAHKIVATCVFTAAPSQAQVEHLHELLPRFKHRYLLLDQNTLATALRVQFDNSLRLTVRYLPPRIKDPDGLTNPAFLLPTPKKELTSGRLFPT